MSFYQAVEEAEERNGDRAEDRPNGVSELLEQDETVGFREGEPLANVGYSSYPQDRESLYLPNTTGILTSIIAAEKVRDQEDLADELGFNRGSQTLSDALEFHNLDLPEQVDHTPSPYVDIPTTDGDKRVNLREFGDDFYTAYTLYVAAGLSITEISQLVENDEQEVRRSLAGHGLL
jgi:hypothetical protein